MMGPGRGKGYDVDRDDFDPYAMFDPGDTPWKGKGERKFGPPGSPLGERPTPPLTPGQDFFLPYSGKGGSMPSARKGQHPFAPASRSAGMNSSTSMKGHTPMGDFEDYPEYMYSARWHLARQKGPDYNPSEDMFDLPEELYEGGVARRSPLHSPLQTGDSYEQPPRSYLTSGRRRGEMPTSYRSPGLPPDYREMLSIWKSPGTSTRDYRDVDRRNADWDFQAEQPWERCYGSPCDGPRSESLPTVHEQVGASGRAMPREERYINDEADYVPWVAKDRGTRFLPGRPRQEEDQQKKKTPPPLPVDGAIVSGAEAD